MKARCSTCLFVSCFCLTVSCPVSMSCLPRACLVPPPRARLASSRLSRHGQSNININNNNNNNNNNNKDNINSKGAFAKGSLDGRVQRSRDRAWEGSLKRTGWVRTDPQEGSSRLQVTKRSGLNRLSQPGVDMYPDTCQLFYAGPMPGPP